MAVPWFKVDDALAMHMKAFTAGNRALGLWVRAGSWSMHQLTDGFIPREVIPALGGDWDDAAALVNARLWHTADGGYRFHDWDTYQPTRDDVLAERAAATERKRASRERSRKVSQGESHRDTPVTDAVTHGGSHSPPSRPVPSRPHDSSKTSVGQSSSKRARETTDSEFTSEMSKRMASQAGIKDPGMLAGLIRTALGITVQWDHLAAIVNHLTQKARSPVKDGQAYAIRCLNDTPEEVSQFIFESGFAA